MINDFFISLSCVASEEENDYQEIIDEWKEKDCSVLFMPAIFSNAGTFNLFDQKAKSDNQNMIWIIPAGQNNYFWLKSLKKEIIEFYETDEIKYPENSSFPHIEAEEFEECILLHSNNIQNDPKFSIFGANVIMYRLALTSGKETLLFILLDHQDCCWKNIIEEYHISLDWLVDSGRGMEDYFERTNLYQLMKNTPYQEILPGLYFQGLYSKEIVPDNMKFEYFMIDEMRFGTDWKYYTSVYSVDWEANMSILKQA